MGERVLACVLSEIEIKSECQVAITTTLGKTKLVDLLKTALAINKGPDFIDELTDWGNFG